MKYLIEECGFDPGTGNKDGLNALHLAVCGGHLGIVKYLISKFADKRFESDNNGNTYLHCAAQEGHLVVVKYLIEECGFDPTMDEIPY
jgi:ankyrin repeat protein